MDDHRELLTFALKWRHWNGGPAEDIFVEFGITPTQFFRRLRRNLTNGLYELPPQIVDQLEDICDLRLHPVELRRAS